MYTAVYLQNTSETCAPKDELKIRSIFKAGTTMDSTVGIFRPR